MNQVYPMKSIKKFENHQNPRKKRVAVQEMKKETSKKSQKYCLVWGALALLLYISRLAGIAPLRLARVANGWRASISKPLCFYGYVLLFGLNASALAGLILDIRTDYAHAIRTRSSTATCLWIAEQVLVFTIIAVCTYETPLKMKHLIEHMNIMNQILVKLKKSIEWQPIETKKFVLTITGASIIIFLNCFEAYSWYLETLHKGKDSTVICLYMAFYAKMCIIFLLKMQFVLVALLIPTSLSCINDKLIELICAIDLQLHPQILCETIDTLAFKQHKDNLNSKIVDDRGLQIQTSMKARETLRTLSSAYADTFVMMGKLNKTYSRFLVLFLSLYFINLAFSPYYYVSFMMSKNNRLSNIVIDTVTIVCFALKVIIIIEPGHQTQIEMERTQMLVSQLLRRVKVEDLLTEDLHHFCKQIEINESGIQAAGFCALNRPLLTAIFGSVTTYITIILQFQSLDANNW